MRRLIKWIAPMFLLAALPLPAAEVLAVGSEFAGIFEASEANGYTGLGVEIVRQLAQKNGDTVRFELYPWNRAQWMVENGYAQVLIGPYKTAEREGKFKFSARPFYRDILAFYTRQGSNVGWNGDYASLRTRKVAVINGWAYGEAFEAARTQIKPELVHTLSNGLTMLAAGRIDLLATNLRNSEAQLRKLDLKLGFAIVAPLIDTQDGYLAYCRSTCERMRQAYDDSFEQMRVSGDLSALARRFEVRLPTP
ncbi:MULTISPECIES: substrate-binding periplasmic protein [unclassified Undibacterium]|uniref:substrate-binding periplasmic protein n=1 Tax=unclassified Undibacterium TaxID=2630295 RepID=UPI002AC94A12|nr:MULTISPECIES: transporter substrate-binding domain-containing protein [unclassified Undibacterium]MEB0137711.1 transporter substrate-binding domain-containing protein [Undibacterium sp. CCC2.1]MEB0172847.1 transporter substrate-binding domain-containing protein [Undibacterium sp. CCC1.1]MEB0176679.1 transporter substrate-binding domain-containing protein [Undibacterium sp. CCC3.4]MEB0215995.1 transporter substrate-binding domain-containing protein [Undibacterium sp. 5I2]WPX42286.1 transport